MSTRISSTRTFNPSTGKAGLSGAQNFARTSAEYVLSSDPKKIGLGLAGLGALFLIPKAVRSAKERASRELDKLR